MKKRLIKILSIILSVLILVSAIGYWFCFVRNKKTTVLEITNPLGTVCLDYKFTDRKITDAESAVAAIGDIADVLGINDPQKELSVISEDTIENYDVYRLQQTFDGIEVFGKQVILTADNEDNAYSLICGYENVNDINTKAKLSKKEANKKLKDNSLSLEITDNIEISGGEKCIYIKNNTAILCYYFEINGFGENGLKSYETLVNAEDGEIVYSQSNIFYDSVTSELAGANVDKDGKKETKIVTYEKDSKENCRMINAEKNMYIYEAVESDITIKGKKYKAWAGTGDKHRKLVEWTNKKDVTDYGSLVNNAADANYNLSCAYDYYESYGLGLYGRKGDNGSLDVYLNLNKLFDSDKNTVDLYTNNAFYWAGDQKNYSECIAFGTATDSNDPPSKYLDVCAHEYTHGVSRSLINWSSVQGSAINEAYSDIMGEVIEYYACGYNDWVYGESRNIKEPQNTLNEPGTHIQNYSEYKDSIDCHLSSTLISHIAYLMNCGYDDSTHFNTSIDMDTLGKLWFYSMYFILSDCTFIDCRKAVELSAKLMVDKGLMNQSQLYSIRKAFEEAGIEDFNASYSVKNEFTFTAYYADKETKVTDYYLNVSKINNGKNDTVFDGKVTDTNYKFKLDSGNYLFTMQIGEKMTGINIKVGEWFCKKDHIDFYTYWSNEKTDMIINETPETDDSEKSYTWLLDPTIEAEDIIVFDKSNMYDTQKNARGELIADKKDYAIIKKDNKYDFIDYSGKELSETFYDDYRWCQCGAVDLFNTDENGYCTDGYYFLDQKFEIQKSDLGCQHGAIEYEVHYNSESGEMYDYNILASVTGTICKTTEETNTPYALVYNGELSTDFIFEDAVADIFGNSGIAVCKKDGKWGYYEYSGKEIIPCQFDAADDGENHQVYLPTDGYIAVDKNGGYGYYDTNGKEVIQCGEFEQARPAYSGRAWVKKNGKWGVISFEKEKSENGQYEITEENIKKVFEDNADNTNVSVDSNPYWVVFHEGSRNGRLEMSTFDAEQNEEGNVKLIWNASIECPTIKGECNQYYYEDGKWIFMGAYGVPTDYAVDIVCTNVDVDDSIENNILKVDDTLFSQYDFSQYPLVVDEPLIDMKCAYIEVIRQARFNFPSYDDEYGYCGYYTKDIDNNGVEELFVFTETCEQDAKVTAYTFTNGNLAELGELSMTHSGIYREGNSFCKIEKYNGKTQGYKFSIVNNALVEDEISLYSLIGSYYSLDHGYSFNNLSHITNLARN